MPLLAREEVLAAMRRRPADPWPRGEGHIVLALPGSRECSKAYLEPGGSFSPCANSFGISLWLTDSKGSLTTSDSIPLHEIQQHFQWEQGHRLPSVVTRTPAYEAIWSSEDGFHWRLRLTLQERPQGEQAFLVVRSVGPAGGPIHSLTWQPQSLTINRRWHLHWRQAPENVHLGHEGDAHWLTVNGATNRWLGPDGWGFARFQLTAAHTWEIELTDEMPPAATALPFTETRSCLRTSLPDKRFQKCLDAQVAHLLMGLVDRETRPGDPLNYPLNWQRDGAYVIAALASSGQWEVSRALLHYFAEQDFFGGFGPEADAPGLSLWAMDQVASQMQDPAYLDWLWPHACRKAALIQQMIAAREPLFAPLVEPLVPGKPLAGIEGNAAMYCKPAQNGLIDGKMDNCWPRLYVNAVSYRGLQAAAQFATRLGQEQAAAQWRESADRLHQSWTTALHQATASENDRTFMASLWPCGIAAKDDPVFRSLLQARWEQRHNARGELREKPLWTYFTLAEAHQWLSIDDTEKVWQTLQWFWEHQTSPGLYTWWEGRGEENSFHRWEQVRGWVTPPNVTPHYWTAAEMLLLQLNMLATVEEEREQSPCLVIGAGIPAAWLQSPLQVEAIPTRVGLVDWHYLNNSSCGAVSVIVHGKSCKVRLAPVFSRCKLSVVFD